jgi:hypothetical protein
MASHDIDWTPSAHVRFESLDFIITIEGELARAPTPRLLLPLASTQSPGPSRGCS